MIKMFDVPDSRCWLFAFSSQIDQEKCGAQKKDTIVRLTSYCTYLQYNHWYRTYTGSTVVQVIKYTQPDAILVPPRVLSRETTFLVPAPVLYFVLYFLQRVVCSLSLYSLLLLIFNNKFVIATQCEGNFYALL